MVHQLRGRQSDRQAVQGIEERAVQLYREKYADYGVTLAAGCLASEDELSVPVRLTPALVAAGRTMRETAESASPTVVDERGGRLMVSWCNWMDRTTTGWAAWLGRADFFCR